MLNNFLISAIDTQTIVMIVLLVIMVVVLVLLPMLTNRRRNKAINEMNASLRPGDIIKTVGGRVGKILEIRDVGPNDKEMVIETGVGDNKSTLVFDIQAVYQVVSKVDAPVAEAPAASAETEAKVEEAPVATEEVKAEEPVVAEEAVSAETPEVATEESAATEEPSEPAEAPKKPRKNSSKK